MRVEGERYLVALSHNLPPLRAGINWNQDREVSEQEIFLHLTDIQKICSPKVETYF
jgi:hypothetical protein